MKRLALLVLLTACEGDPRGECIHQYVDHYDTHASTEIVDKVPTTTVHQDPVYECDVWYKMQNDSVLVSTKIGRDRVVYHVRPER